MITTYQSHKYIENKILSTCVLITTPRYLKGGVVPIQNNCTEGIL